MNAGKLFLKECSVTDNSAQEQNGGGLYNTGLAAISGCTFQGNSTFQSPGDDHTGGEGGAIDNLGTVNLIDSTISGNTATTPNFRIDFFPIGGAAIYNYGTAEISNCTMTNNGPGELADAQNGSDGTFILANSIVSGDGTPPILQTSTGP